eukprot:gene9426-245_t
MPAVSAQLLQVLDSKDALRLPSTCLSMRGSLKFSAVPSVPLSASLCLSAGLHPLRPEDYPMLVATKTCSAVALWFAVVEGAVCLLAGLPSPAEAAAAALDALRRHDLASRVNPCRLPAHSANTLEVPHWPFLHDWAQARVQASRAHLLPSSALRTESDDNKAFVEEIHQCTPAPRPDDPVPVFSGPLTAGLGAHHARHTCNPNEPRCASTTAAVQPLDTKANCLYLD